MAARVTFQKPLLNFTTPTFQEEIWCAESLLLPRTAPGAVSSVGLIENSIQLTSNVH